MGRQPARVGLMALVLSGLLVALWGGLIRIGWPWPSPNPLWVVAHGPLFVSGVLGTLISLERALAVQKPWAYAAPVLSAIGIIALVGGAWGWPSALPLALASVVLLAIFVVVGHRTLHVTTMALGAVAWLVGNILWLVGLPLFHSVVWWVGFLVLTIAGERLELSRVLRLTRWPRLLFGGAIGLCLIGLVVSIVIYDLGVRLLGTGLLTLTLWLARYDVARRTIRQPGLTRFIAWALLSGYVWLGVAGVLALINGGVMAGPSYDAWLHAVFVGFVFSMIFGHAPIIFPAVLRITLRFDKSFYAPLALLHLSLALRLGADLLGWVDGRRWGGLVNALALLLYFANIGRVTVGPTLLRGKNRQTPAGGGPPAAVGGGPPTRASR